ncbi:MAG: tetratricopeptide repeat protein [Chitinophagaceae bacterium]|nr:MAG: tetratricopeptide repeat protein [Chitinophagaceae bacterium]
MQDAGAYIHRAQVLIDHSRFADAENELKRAIQIEPDNDYILSLMAKCRMEFKDYAKATELIQSAISRAPEEDYYYYLLAFMSYQQDKNTLALQNLKKAVTLNPYAEPYFGLWAMVLIEERQFKEALEKADEGLALDPEDLTCLNARATALNKLRRTEDAVITMQNALEKDPENQYTHVNVGFNLLEKGKHREATMHFREALRLDPTMDSARSGLKEALKSRVAPYRWLLQYNYWITNKSRQARWAIPIALLIAVRIFDSASSAAGSQWKIVGGVVIGLYLLFVATSWIINPLANFFLLFDKDGKYAITSNERWNAITFTVAIGSGLIICLASLFPGGFNNPNEGLLAAGLIIMSVSIPLGHMRFPWALKGSNFLQIYSMLLVCLSIIAAAVSVFIEGELGVMGAVYFVAFAAFMWVHAFSRR